RLLVGERALLVDGLDPEVARALHREVADGLALPPDGASVGGVEAGDDLDQGRLAGAVVAEPPDDLVHADREADVLRRSHVVERLRDALELEQVRRRRLHGLCGSFAESGGAPFCAAALVHECRVEASRYLISLLTSGISGPTLLLLMIPEPVSMYSPANL